MQKQQNYFNELVKMTNELCGYNIDLDCFSKLFDSPLIMESLSYIQGLLQEGKLIKGIDILEVKKKFNDYFIFFSEESNKESEKKYSNKDLTLLITFLVLSLISGISCIYLPGIFIPLVCFFSISWIIIFFVITIKNYIITAERKDNFTYELSYLKYNLNQLKNELASKYPVKIRASRNLDNNDQATNYSTESKPCQKKLVTFSLITELNFFFIESFEKSTSVNNGQNGPSPK